MLSTTSWIITSYSPDPSTTRLRVLWLQRFIRIPVEWQDRALIPPNCLMVRRRHDPPFFPNGGNQLPSGMPIRRSTPPGQTRPNRKEAQGMSTETGNKKRRRREEKENQTQKKTQARESRPPPLHFTPVLSSLRFGIRRGGIVAEEEIKRRKIKHRESRREKCFITRCCAWRRASAACLCRKTPRRGSSR
jgi:hypothetical protein